MVGAHVLRPPILSTLLSLCMLALACSGAFTTPGGKSAPPPTPVPDAQPPSGVIVETSATGDHGTAGVPVWANDPRWGDWDAPVTIVEFGDLECPFTSTADPHLRSLEDRYGPTKLRVIWKHLPLAFHRSARSAADAAATVFGLGGSTAFWKFTASALGNQKDLTEENYATWAESAGLTRTAYFDAYGTKRFTGKVDDDLALSSKLGITGTPHFRINGVAMRGAQPLEKFVEVVDRELAKAEKLVAAGTRPADVYVTLTKQNLAAEPAPSATSRAEADDVDDTVWRVPVFHDDPTQGPADALVTLVEFSDFQCPFCKRVEPTVKALMDAHPGVIRRVWKDNPLPFHAAARPSAILGRVVFDKLGNTGFWQAHGALFESQPNLESDALKTITLGLGLEWAPVERAIKKNVSKKVDESIGLSVDLEARGTPHFFMNGVRLSGAQPIDRFEALFARRLEAAQALVATGVARDNVYEATIKDGRTAEPPKRVEVPPPDATTPTRGPATAKVTIQIFTDFQCPFCKRVLPTLKEVEKEFAGRVKLVFRHNPLPFHEDAQLASEAAQEVFAQKGTAAFWRYHDALFEAQATPDGLERPSLEALAQKQGVVLSKLQDALDQHKHLAKVQADLAVAKAAGLSGTPMFVVNGYLINGAQPVTAFRKVVALALAEQRGAPAKTRVVP
jgi:protein-disulfide isomerase